MKTEFDMRHTPSILVSFTCVTTMTLSVILARKVFFKKLISQITLVECLIKGSCCNASIFGPSSGEPNWSLRRHRKKNVRETRILRTVGMNLLETLDNVTDFMEFRFLVAFGTSLSSILCIIDGINYLVIGSFLQHRDEIWKFSKQNLMVSTCYSISFQ